jgi:hypothetical protein
LAKGLNIYYDFTTPAHNPAAGLSQRRTKSDEAKDVGSVLSGNTADKGKNSSDFLHSFLNFDILANFSILLTYFIEFRRLSMQPPGEPCPSALLCHSAWLMFSLFVSTLLHRSENREYGPN